MLIYLPSCNFGESLSVDGKDNQIHQPNSQGVVFHLTLLLKPFKNKRTSFLICSINVHHQKVGIIFVYIISVKVYSEYHFLFKNSASRYSERKVESTETNSIHNNS